MEKEMKETIIVINKDAFIEKTKTFYSELNNLSIIELNDMIKLVFDLISSHWIEQTWIIMSSNINGINEMKVFMVYMNFIFNNLSIDDFVKKWKLNNIEYKKVEDIYNFVKENGIEELWNMFSKSKDIQEFFKNSKVKDNWLTLNELLEIMGAIQGVVFSEQVTIEIIDDISNSN